MTELLIYFRTKVYAEMAMEALMGRFTTFPPQLAPKPINARSWVLEVHVPDWPLSDRPDARTMGTVQAIVNKYDGEIHQEESLR